MVLMTDLPEEGEEFPAEYSDPLSTIGGSEIENSSYLQPVDSSTIEPKDASLFLWMQTVLYNSKSLTLK